MSRLVSGHKKRLGVPLAITTLATILLAAIDPERNAERIKAMPLNERQRLFDTLKKFDLVYTPREQQTLREVDRRLNELEPERRAHYLTVLRRYHNWLSSLSDAKRDELRSTAPDQRMALVKKLVGDNPVPRADTPRLLKITDVAEYTPFELAAFFKVWQILTQDEKQRADKLTDLPARRRFLLNQAVKKELPQEILPDEFKERDWVGRVASFLKNARPGLLQVIEDMKNRPNDTRAAQIVRRLAINHYFLDNPPPAVTPERLAQFLAVYPSWIQSTFDGYPPDEARRRLTIVYRLVYPQPEEIPPPAKGPARAPGAATTPGRASTSSGPARSEGAATPPPPTKRSDSPF